MSKASDGLIQSLCTTIARATSECTDRVLISNLDDRGFGATFDSPIEQMFFLGFCAHAIHRGRAVRFVPGRLPEETYRKKWSCRLDGPRGGVIATITDSVGGDTSSEDVLDGWSGSLIGPAQDPTGIVRVFAQVEHESYRLDFLVVDSTGARVAIECDGHDYHERTKEQARHDRRRDRALLIGGLACLRFTGSELFGNAMGCAAEVFDFLEAQESA